MNLCIKYTFVYENARNMYVCTSNHIALIIYRFICTYICLFINKHKKELLLLICPFSMLLRWYIPTYVGDVIKMYCMYMYTAASALN
jgi:hypothetical protein